MQVRSITTEAEARAFLKECIETIGQGFHIDTPFADYRDDEGKRTFTAEEVLAYDRMMDEAFNWLLDDIYEIAGDMLLEARVMADRHEDDQESAVLA